MNTKHAVAVLAALFAILHLAACSKVSVNPNDKTPPQIEIKVKGADGQYAVASSGQLSASAQGQLDWMCTVSDADGVKSMQITYSSSLDGCTAQSTPANCVASYQPQPQSLFQDLQPDANGKVLAELVVLATVKGPFTCSCPGQGSGVPFGRSIKATCTGKNWSSDPAKQSTQKVLTIDLQ